jgi:hypothetical protein
MPEAHDIGPRRFIQLLDNYHVTWGNRLFVRGWTQEIEEPYRFSEPLILRLPRGKALVFGRWIGELSEEEALDKAVQRRDLTDEDFDEENGWVPATDEDSEESLADFHT